MQAHHQILFDETLKMVLTRRSRKHFYFPCYKSIDKNAVSPLSLMCFNQESIMFSYIPFYCGTFSAGKNHYHTYQACASTVYGDHSTIWIPIESAPNRNMVYAAIFKIRQYHLTMPQVTSLRPVLSTCIPISEEQALQRIIQETQEISPGHTVLSVQDFEKTTDDKITKWEALLEVLVR